MENHSLAVIVSLPSKLHNSSHRQIKVRTYKRIHSLVTSSRSKPSALGGIEFALDETDVGGGSGTASGILSSWSERCEGERRDSTLPASEKSVLSERPVQREKSVLQRDSSPSQDPLGVGTVLAGRLRDA